ncbi:unnamed protein product [Anisakis simplex]|uniref:Palmitoyltransferase n=1 Tax=Anisakis simplex TaxID=6269 RepID=A0A0M3IZ53_ANISI|nr:unnamed protein product [Anisakis simplex]
MSSANGMHQRRPPQSRETGDSEPQLNGFDEDMARFQKIYAECEVLEPPEWKSGLERGKGDFGKTMFRRLFHWGPIIAIAITLSIGLTATYLHLQWWPLNSVGAFVHLTVFLYFNYSVLSNLCRSAFIGPGYVPLKWSPPEQEFESHLQFCVICDGYKVPRSHHCSRCGRCVMKMDHHCRKFAHHFQVIYHKFTSGAAYLIISNWLTELKKAWINNCVGHRNHAYFVRFLAMSVVGCTHAALIISFALYRGIFRIWFIQHGVYDGPEVLLTIYTFILSVFAFGLALGVIVAVGFLLIVQLRSIHRNRTGIEDYILDKANSYERKIIFLYPYDLGWKRNFREVLGTWDGLPKTNGVWWPVRRPTTQFTFSEEQLTQKRLKRLNAREVRIVRPFEGTCLSTILIGVRVFLCQPCSDEERIAVKVGEHWMVTRVNKYWFYATKKEAKGIAKPEESVRSSASESSETFSLSASTVPNHLHHPHYRPPRGWFPRVCAEQVECE